MAMIPVASLTKQQTNAPWIREDTASRQPQGNLLPLMVEKGLVRLIFKFSELAFETLFFSFRGSLYKEYGCDGINICTENGCKNTTIDGEPTEVCCCDGNL